MELQRGVFTHRLPKLNHEWLEFNQNGFWTLDFLRGSKCLGHHDTLYLAPSFVCCSTAEVKILKVISRVSYYCSMGPGRSAEPKQQCWLERPSKINLNSLWHKTFIYPTDTGSIAPGCLTQPRSIFHTFTMDKQHWLWHSYQYWSMSRCVCMRVCVCACAYVLYVCDKCWICDRAALPKAVLEKLLLCSMIELSFFPISSPLSHPVCIYLTLLSLLLPCIHPLQQGLNFSFCLPLLCLRPGEALRL